MGAWVIAVGIYEGQFDREKWRWKTPEDDKK